MFKFLKRLFFVYGLLFTYNGYCDMKKINSIFDVINNYDVIFCDMNGVIHNGESLYPNVIKSMEKLIELKKKIILLSNAARPAEKVRESLLKMGLPEKSVENIVTSGDTLRSYITEGEGVFSEKRDEYKFYVLGDRGFIDSLPKNDITKKIKVVDNLDDAHYVLINGAIENDNEKEKILKDILSHEITCFCTNPDMVALKGNELIKCPGDVASALKKRACIVHEFGKPHKIIYDQVFKKYPHIKGKRILCVGDTVLTDVKGAKDCDLDSLLITGGVLTKTHGVDGGKDVDIIKKICAMHGVEPIYYTEYFGASI